MTIQNIMFKKKYFTLNQANHYIKKHHYKPIKEVHETDNFYRYRLAEPSLFKRFRVLKLKRKGIRLTVGF
jgi:hypothetical protein